MRFSEKVLVFIVSQVLKHASETAFCSNGSTVCAYIHSTTLDRALASLTGFLIVRYIEYMHRLYCFSPVYFKGNVLNSYHQLNGLFNKLCRSIFKNICDKTVFIDAIKLDSYYSLP
jgi:hypothetical protein